MGIRDFVRKIVLKEKSSSESYVAYLRSKGMAVGEDVTIYVPQKTTIDLQYPWMIEIGDHVRITQGVVILTHDYSWYVLKGCSGAVYGASGPVKIGNNVFIGMNAIITRNVTIGNNVIIGAGSVVTKDCLDNGVYAGNPAKRLMDIETFQKKRAQAQIQEAKELALSYYRTYGKLPEKEVFHEYFMLFLDEKAIQANDVFAEKMRKHGNPEQSESYLAANRPLFENYEQFLTFCLKGLCESQTE